MRFSKNGKSNVYIVNIPFIADLKKANLEYARMSKAAPCGVCGKKSTARFRYFPEKFIGKMYVFGVCDEHFDELKRIVDLVSGYDGDTRFFINDTSEIGSYPSNEDLT